MSKFSGNKVTRAARGTPSAVAHVIAFALGGSLAALVTRRPQDDAAAPTPMSLPAASTAAVDEPEEPAVASWEWAAEPAPQPAEFATDAPSWSPQNVWERLALDEPDEFEPAPSIRVAQVEEAAPPVAPAAHAPRKPLPRRLAATAAIVTMFFAGAALSAGAGDQVASMLESTTTTETTADAPAAGDPAPAADPAAAPEAAPAPDPAADPAAADAADDPAPVGGPGGGAASASGSEAPSGGASAPSDPSASPADGDQPVPAASGSAGSAGGYTQVPSQKQAVKRLKRAIKARPPKLDVEASMPNTSAVVWLNRAMPDPTPAAKRLTDPFAHDLAVTSKKAGADWALVLGVLRASGAEGRVPAGHETIRGLAVRLANLKANGKTDQEAVFDLMGDSMLADKAVALSHYNHAVGLWALVHGLEAAKKAMTKRVLADERIDVYVGGREDLMDKRINVRVIALMAYLADTFDQVTVSCLESGHRLYARPGVVSAHMYGLAVDISALDETTIEGHQEPGGITEQAVRDILLLPSELQPKQVISLLGLGGASFPLPNHADHIHVGY
jgi:hypothetical protein